MNLTRLAIVLGALIGVGPVAAYAQTQTLPRAQPATQWQAVPSSSPDCSSCGPHVKSRYTQYARPYPGCSFAYKDTPYPKGPCCATLVGQFLCDVGYGIGRLFACKHDVLGVGCDECGGDSAYCADPIDCVPRFRDLCCGPGWGRGWWKPYPGQLGGSYETWPYDGFGGYVGSEVYNAQEADSGQPSPPAENEAEQPQAEEPPEAVNSTRLRSVLPPSASRPPQPIFRQSHRFAPAARRGMGMRRYGPSRAVYFARPAPAPARQTRSPAAVSKPKAQPATRIPKSMVPIDTVRPNRFGDQFGKSLRPGSRGATFR